MWIASYFETDDTSGIYPILVHTGGTLEEAYKNLVVSATQQGWDVDTGCIRAKDVGIMPIVEVETNYKLRDF